VSDLGDNRIVEIPPGKGPQTVLSNIPFIYGIALDAANDIFLTDYQNDRILELAAGSKTPITLATNVGPAYGLTIDTKGDLWYSDFASANAISELPRTSSSWTYFQQTELGTTSSDSPATSPVQNGGNQNLSVTAVAVAQPANYKQAA